MFSILGAGAENLLLAAKTKGPNFFSFEETRRSGCTWKACWRCHSGFSHQAWLHRPEFDPFSTFPRSRPHCTPVLLFCSWSFAVFCASGQETSGISDSPAVRRTIEFENTKPTSTFPTLPPASLSQIKISQRRSYPGHTNTRYFASTWFSFNSGYMHPLSTLSRDFFSIRLWGITDGWQLFCNHISRKGHLVEFKHRYICLSCGHSVWSVVFTNDGSLFFQDLCVDKKPMFQQ